MEQRTKELLWAFFSPETAGEQDDLRRSIRRLSDEHRGAARSGLAQVLRSQSLTVKSFYDITDTDLEIETEDEVYAEIAKAYEFLFDEPAPAFEGRSS